VITGEQIQAAGLVVGARRIPLLQVYGHDERHAGQREGSPLLAPLPLTRHSWLNTAQCETAQPLTTTFAVSAHLDRGEPSAPGSIHYIDA
jgi:hypothetical protein